MKIIEIIIADLFEGISKDELITNLQQKRQASYLDMILKKMHELVQSQGDRQSVGGSAFEISKYLGGAISGRELEQMYRKKYMNESQVNEWGRIVKGVNTTVDVGTDEIKRQAAKFGNTVDKDGFPPSMTSTAKAKSTTVKHHTPVKESELPRYTAAEWAIIEGGHSLEDLQESKPPMPKQPGKLFTALTEGYKLQLERDKDLMVLHIKDNASGKRTEVRGKPGYETNGYDANDPLHKLLDVVGKSANISELMNGEVVTINPKHPNAQRALAATDRAYNEAFDTDVEWVEGPGAGGSTVYAAMVDKAYIEITYKPMSKGVYINFTRGGVMSVTGEGSQNKVFGAVINHIKQWVAKNKPEQIVFSAWKPRTGAFGSQDTTRSGLYRKMVQRFANQNGYDYDVEDTGNEDTFILKRQQADTQTNEALNNPYPVRWSSQNNQLWYGHAKEENRYDQIGISIKQLSDGVWDINFSVNDTKQKTGGGDQFKIFATVQAAIKEWWNWAKTNTDVEKITFSAERIADTSRAKLYQRFAKQFATAIGYTLRVDSKGNYDTFNIEKPDVTENFAESKVNYKTPNFEYEWEEAERYPEFVKIGKEAWIELAKKGKAVTIKSAKGINNTDAADPDSFSSLDKTKQSRALDQLKSGTIEMPIVAVYSDGWKELIGGNTRLTSMLAQNKKANVWAFKVPDEVAELAENFADGKKPGRKGLAKRSGVNTKASVSDLRKTAKNSSGEKQRMAHWLANMKAGKAKKK